MFSSLKFFFLFSFEIFFSTFIFPQSYNFKNYSAEQGLPFVQVYCIFQDSKGNLWTGGYGGLSKFDGQEFINYSPKNGLANHWVTSIAEDAQGNIWIGTISGLSKYDGKKFETFTTKNGLLSDNINSLTADKNGNLWVATSKGISVYNSTSKNFASLTTKNGLSSDAVSLVYADKAGNIWIGSDSGVSKIIFTNKHPQDRCFGDYSTLNSVYDSVITSIAEDAQGNIFFGTNNGVVKYDGINFKTFSVKDGLLDNFIQSVAKDEHSNSIWVATLKGLNNINADEKIKSFRVSDIPNGNKVGKLFTDAEGNLWLGTSNGLYRFRDASFETFSAKEGLMNPMIFPIFRDSKKNLWVGTNEEGFFKYDNKTFKNISEKNGLLGTRMNAGMEDKNGNIWMGTNKGVSIFSPDKNSFKNFGGKKDGLKSDSVTSIIQDKNGNIWLGGNQGGTIFSPDGKLKTFTLESSGENFDVWCEFEDSKGNIWLGTYVGGLFRYDGKVFENYSQKLNLKSKTYLAITEDKDGNLYFGSFDGIYIYNPTTKNIFFVSEKNGLTSDLIYVMAFDSSYENLYIGTNQGINSFNVKEWKSSGKILLQNFGTEEGLKSLETNSNGIWRDDDGTFWFGTVNGLVHFDPYAVHHNQTESQTSITGMKIFYADTILPQNAELSYDANNILFEYIGICLTNPEKVKYKFKLEGFDKSWSPETKETTARYANLAPGKYIFKVTSCNNEGVWDSAPAEFSFSILAPIWKRGWFVAGEIISGIILLLILFRLRANAIRKKEAEKLSREIELATNELKALRAQMDPHFIFNSLSSIQSFIMTKDEDSALKYLNKFAKLMRMILSNSEKSSVTIREEIDSLKLYLELEALRWENKFDYEIKISPEVETDFHKIPSMLIQPYVENAIIHGISAKENGKGKIEITISQTDTYIICTIADNGIGRKKSEELKKNSSHPKHESMGMKITNERLEVLNRIHKSNLSVNIIDEEENGIATGTKVEIFIPV